MHKYRIVLVWLSFIAVASAQNFYPKKDAVFGQVVVGGGYETIINIANRGSREICGHPEPVQNRKRREHPLEPIGQRRRCAER